MSIVIRQLVMLLFVLASCNAGAEIYKCVDTKTGTINLTDVACDDKQVGSALAVKVHNSRRVASNKRQYKFPDSGQQYAKLDVTSNRCEKIREALDSVSELIAVLERNMKIKDAPNKRVQDLKLDYKALAHECPG